MKNQQKPERFSYTLALACFLCLITFGIQQANSTSCLSNNYPLVQGGYSSLTQYFYIDMDSQGNIAVGGTTYDNGLALTSSQSAIVIYIANGGTAIWGYRFYSSSKTYNQVESLKFNPGGNKIAVLFDSNGYSQGWTIIIISATDGTLITSYKSNAEDVTVCQYDCLLFDSSNLIHFTYTVYGNYFKVVSFDASAAETATGTFSSTLSITSSTGGNQCNGLTQAITTYLDSKDENLFTAGTFCYKKPATGGTGPNFQTWSGITVFNKATGSMTSSYARTQGNSILRTFKRMSAYETSTTIDFALAEFITASNQYMLVYLQYSTTTNSWAYEKNMKYTYSAYVVQIKCLGNYQMYMLLEWSDHKEISFIDFSTPTFKYQYLTAQYTTNTYFFYAKFISNTEFYYIGRTVQIDALSQTFSQYVGFIQNFNPSEGTCIPHAFTFPSTASQTVFNNNYTEQTSSTMKFEYTVTLLRKESSLIYSYPLTMNVISNSFCPQTTTLLTLNPPTAISDQIYIVYTSTATFIHDAFTISESCDDATIYHSYSKVSWPDVGPTITYNATSRTFTWYDNINTHVGQTYQIQITAKIGNGQSATTTFNLIVQRECYFAYITSYGINDVYYDVSQGTSATIASLDWTSNMTSSTCQTSSIYYYLYDTTTMTTATSSVFGREYSTTPETYYAQTANTALAGTVYNLKLQAYLQGYVQAEQAFKVTITNNCPSTVINTNGAMSDQSYQVGMTAQYISIPTWTETYGYCGPFTYNIKSNGTAMSTNQAVTPLAYISTNTSIQIYTTASSDINTYVITITGTTSKGSVSTSITFNINIYPDYCSTATVTTTTIKDTSLYIAQTGQTYTFSPFTIYSTAGVKLSCGTWAYTITDGSGNTLDSVFSYTQTPSITLASTSTEAKKDLSPQTIKVTGVPGSYPSLTTSVTFKIYLVYNYTTDCPQGQYYNTSTLSCNTCISPCSSCLDYSRCTWCVSGYNYIEDSSYSCILTSISCPAGTVIDNNLAICRSCPTHCSTCSSTTTCTTCLSDYSLASDGKCYKTKQCPSGTRYDSITNQCETCPSNCEACSASSTCSYCSSGYYLTSSNTCSSSCSSGFYANSTTRTCMICQPDCATCTTNNYTCTSCNSGYYLYNSNCVSRCPYEGYYENSLARTCDDCYAGCLYCIASTTDCPVCRSGYVRNSRTCTSACSASQYIDVNEQCQNCHSNCYACTDAYNYNCSVCNTGYYLFGSTCDSTCPYGYFANAATLTCDQCPYYCDSCSSLSVCNVCNAGYKRVGTTCIGEYYLKTSTAYTVSVPISSSLSTYDPTALTVEIWFKFDNVTTTSIEVILGASPYKIRRKSGTTQIELNYNANVNYCTTSNLNVLTWYHFAFAIDQDYSAFSCYLNGQSYSTGSGTGLITTDVQKLTEITFGATVYPKTSETNFNGYLREFRWWGVARSAFNISSFMNMDYITIPSTMIAYWKLGEPNDGSVSYYTDSNTTSVTYTPSAPYGITTIQEMKEIYLKFCPEGYYAQYDSTNGYYSCYQCNGFCKNCLNSTQYNCTECNSPYVLVESQYQCVLIGSCPTGYFKNSSTGLCQNCDPYCKTCYGSSTYCPICKPQYFREYKGSGCVSECPTGMYGNYASQTCLTLPTVRITTPIDGTLFTYGTLINTQGSYTMLNGESNGTFTYGWVVTRTKGSLDISDDAVKNYANYNGLKVHLDNNVIESNNNYNITFYVKGNGTYYKGMLKSDFIEIYVGIPPMNGKCSVSPMSGYAASTIFTIQTSGWVDEIGIQEYNYYYSFDSGETYLPINEDGYTQTSINYTSKSIYQNYQLIIKCEAINKKGFSNYAVNQIVLNKRSNADATTDLSKLNTTGIATEISCLQTAQQLYLLAQNLGSLSNYDNQIFDPKLSSKDDCQKSICNGEGTCIYQSYTKKYYCSCSGAYGGQNCTFKDKTQIEQLTALALNLTIVYQQIGTFNYPYEFLKLTSAFKEVLNDTIVSSCITILKTVIMNWDSNLQSQDTIQNYLVILSNLLEYIEYDLITVNATNTWSKYPVKSATTQQNVNDIMTVFYWFKNNSLYSINNLDTMFAYTSRMISFKQLYTSTSSFNKFSATNNTKSPQTTFIKMSSGNFMNLKTKIESNIVLEAIEYAFNPYQINNTYNLATNPFEVNIYNFSTYSKVSLTNLSNPFEFFFPGNDNTNLSSFIETYNSLNQYKTAEQTKRVSMVKNSKIDCNYWNGTAWNNSGCTLSTIDSTHVRCSCNHLSMFGPQFITPISESSTTSSSDLIKAELEEPTDITLDEIVKWPLSDYINNLHELMQHKPPSALSFFFKPGVYIILLFWIMYVTSLVYYNGKDKLKRYGMTKGQNRNDLAEMKGKVRIFLTYMLDNEIQNLDAVIKDLLARDLGQINEEQEKLNQSQFNHSPKKQLGSSMNLKTESGLLDQKPRALVFEDLEKDQKKKIKRRARKKVFGRVGTLSERAKRFYTKALKGQTDSAEAKMKFFNEELKNNFWIGLMGKTSKIAPRHARLTLMYFYISLHLTMITIIYAFNLKSGIIEDGGTFGDLAIGAGTLWCVWIVTIPVGLIFRMPMCIKRQIEGVKTKKLNKAFIELDKQMGIRYAIGYFICYTSYILMTLTVTFFNYFYPQSYTFSWMFTVIILYVLDLLVFTMAIAGLQLLNALISQKIKCWYSVWAAFEIFRYIKNLRG